MRLETWVLPFYPCINRLHYERTETKDPGFFGHFVALSDGLNSGTGIIHGAEEGG
jgi:hypothetical protein